MSTIHFSTSEWGWIVSRWVASGALHFTTARDTAAIAALSNARAYCARYEGEVVSPDNIPSADEIEAAALQILAKPETWLSGPCCGGGVVYNCAEDPGLSRPIESLGGVSLADFLEPVETTARKWLDGLKTAQRRREEDDAAYAEEGPLPAVPWSDIAGRAKAAGMSRVIIAEFQCDQSDSQSDYWGSRTARTVVIGFGKGKRENFRELRKAAAVFPPAEDVAFDRVSVVANHRPGDDQYNSRTYVWEDREGRRRFFRSEDDARAALAELHATAPECQPGYTGCVGFPAMSQEYGVRFVTNSPENRENYSMGGGNYLGWSRYSGWLVYSDSVEYVAGRGGAVEFFEAPAIVKNGKSVIASPAIPRKPTKPPVQFPIWTKKGLLQKEACSVDWPHVYRKPETAQKDVDRLAAMGIVATVREGRGRAAYFVQMVSQPDQATKPEPATPQPVRFDVLANC